MAMTFVRLHGALGKRFGREFQFDISCAAEAINALECAKPGFRQAILEMQKHVFRVRVGNKYIVEDRLTFPNNGRVIAITPILEGAASSKGIFQIIAGVVLIAAGIVFSSVLGPLAAPIIGIGVSLVFGGVASLLAPSPPQQKEAGPNSASYIFNGAINVMAQGGPVPLAYGLDVFTGTSVISADITATDIAIGSTGTVPAGNNTGSSDPGDPDLPAVPAYESESFA